MAMWKSVENEHIDLGLISLDDPELIPRDKIKWVKPREPKLFFSKKKIRRYLYNIPYKVKLSIIRLTVEFQIKRKFVELCKLLFNIAVTGFLIQIILTHKGWISYGLTVALIVYYFEIIVKLVKMKGE